MPSKGIDITDFRGGRNTYRSMDLIGENQHSAGQNVWAENLALASRRGATAAAIAIGTAQWRPYQLRATKMAASSQGRLAMFCVNLDSTPLGIAALLFTDNGTTFSYIKYALASVQTNATTTVTGTLTTWLTDGIGAGDYFMVDSVGTLVRIASVASDTSLTLDSSYAAAGPGAVYTIIRAIASATRPVAMFTFDVSSLENLIVSDGTNPVYRWDGTTLNTITAAPKRHMMVVHKNYVFAAAENGVDIQWCAIKDITTWPTANKQTVSRLNDPIRGLYVYNDYIVIFCRNSIYRLLGDTFDPTNPTYVLQKIPTQPGYMFKASRSIVNHRGVMKFLTSDGWFAYEGGNSIEKISIEIQTDTDLFGGRNEATEGFTSDSHVGYVWKNRMWVAVAQNVDLTRAFIQDENDAWWMWVTNNLSSGAWCDFEAIAYSGGTVVLHAGARGSSNLYTIDTGTADPEWSVGIDASWDSKAFTSSAEMEFIEAVVWMKKQASGNLTLSFSIDRATYVDKTCDMTAGVGTFIQKRVPIARIGKEIRVKVGSTSPFEVYRIKIITEPTDGART